jgi:hypothetical protein
MARFSALIVALALMLAACNGDGGASTTTLPDLSTAPTTGETTTTAAPSTTVVEEIPNGPLPGTENLPPEVRAELDQLVAVTEETRGLQFLEMPTVTIVTSEELASRVQAQIAEETEDFPADEALYQLLGLLAEDANLEGILTELYGEQVAGYYDGDVGELVVPMREDGFSVVQRATLVHELTHAVTDQRLEFDAAFDAMIDEERLDEASAYQALIEGDASLAELHYLQSLTQAELGEFFAEALEIDTSALDAAPPFIQDSLIFPYDSGLAFTQQIYDDQGWEGVNDAYATMPGLPGTTEQVITPADFGRDLPTEVAAPALSVPNYQLERTSVWGELGLRLMIDQVLGEDTGVTAADGWGGDSYHQWFDGTNAAMLLVYEGDTDRDAEELRQALVSYADAAIDDEDFVSVEIVDGRLMFIVADETSVGELIQATVAP